MSSLQQRTKPSQKVLEGEKKNLKRQTCPDITLDFVEFLCFFKYSKHVFFNAPNSIIKSWIFPQVVVPLLPPSLVFFTFLFKKQNFNWLLNTPLIRPYVSVTGWPEEGSLWSQRGSDVANIYSRVRTSPVELWTGHLQWWRDQSQSALVPDLWPLHQVFDPTPGVVVVVTELKEKQVFEGDFFKPESILNPWPGGQMESTDVTNLAQDQIIQFCLRRIFKVILFSIKTCCLFKVFFC